MAVQDQRHRITADRLFEPARTEERINFERLAIDRFLDRRIVQQGNQLCRAQPGERRFELQRLVHRFADELLDDGFAPRTERSLPEPAAEALHTGDADAAQLARIAVEDDNSGVGEDLADLIGLARFEIVIPQHRGHWHPQRGHFPGEHARLIGQAIVGQVARDQQDVGRLRNPRKERLKSALRGPGAMRITHRRDTHHVPSHRAPWGFKSYAKARKAAG